MKRTAAILLGLALSFAAQAQQKISIEGTITAPAESKVIVLNATNVNILPESRQETLDLSADGKFHIDIPVTQKFNWIIIAHNNKRLDFFVKEGSTLQLTASGAAIDTTAHFEGKGREIPEYFAVFTRKRGGIMEYYRKTQEIAINDPAGYRKVLDSLKLKEEMLASKEKSLPGDFVKYWSSFLQFSVYDAMLHYPGLHEMLRLKTQNIQQIPGELFVVTKKTPKVFNDELLDIAFYQTYVQSYFSSILMASGYNNVQEMDTVTGLLNFKKALQQTDSALHLMYTAMPPKTGEFAAGRMLATESRGWPLEVLEPRVAEYNKRYPNSENNKILESMVAGLKKFSPGQPAVDFSFTTLDGKEMKLSDLKGKVVYMDFWASWCGPCKGEMPHAKEVKKHFEGKDVVFLYVSIDEKEDAWKRGITALDISGMHTRTPGWKGPIASLYRIESVPAYFLIDRKGNFVSRHTPRPSQKDELIKLIESQL